MESYLQKNTLNSPSETKIKIITGVIASIPPYAIWNALSAVTNHEPPAGEYPAYLFTIASYIGVVAYVSPAISRYIPFNMPIP